MDSSSNFEAVEMEDMMEDEDEGDFEMVSPETVMDLPEELVSKIFSYLSPESFSAVAAVCRSWRAIVSSPSLWRKRCDVVWSHLMAVTVRSSDICFCLAMIVSDKKFTPRVKLLSETLHELTQTAQARLNPGRETHHPVDSYYMMTNILLSQLYDCNSILRKIEINPLAITENFDILDLTLRRYMHQIHSMFPIDTAGQPQETPSHLIEDEQARLLWEKFVGKDAYSVEFNWFYESVMIPTFPSLRDDHRFRNAFQFFVNFPCDDMLTTCKWGVIVDQFGPFDEFVDNFRHFACGNGFLGLINCVEADEHLSSPNTFLLRFSRREPEKLTFSYKYVNNARAVVCRHKRKPCGVPIRQFISQYFGRSFRPVEKSLAIVEKGVLGLDEYCDQSGYLL